ncbi:MAG TPA: SH3 domain-containing protein [Terracidiphilus sp.]
MYLLSLLLYASGCGHLHHKSPPDTVYVSARGNLYLHDRVAVVSNRVAEVENGEALQVIERAGRFIRVKTAKGQQGWIEQSAVVDHSIYDQFAQLAASNKEDPIVATGILDDEPYMHILPGRSTEHFYLLPAHTKVELLARASAPKVPLLGAAQTAQPAKAVPGLPQSPSPVMEDWWLGRDSRGRTGWLLGSRVYVNVPDDIAQYAEGQQIVGAYLLKKVEDPESNFPNHEAPEYVTLEAPLSAGRPFDYNEVRVFTWSLRHHRYETAFRLRPIAGFLPVKTGTEKGPNGSDVPTFSFVIADNDNVVTDPATGITKPASPRTIRYEMIDTVVKRIGPDMAPIPLLDRGERKRKADAHKRTRRK